MKIETKINKNFLKIYSEARGIAAHKQRILQTKKTNSLSYLEECTILSILFLIIGLIIKTNRQYFSSVYGSLIILFSIGYYITVITRIYTGYLFRKKKNFKNTIVIDEKGIKDISSFDGMEIRFTWKTIEAIVIKQNTLVILTNRSVYFYFDKKDKDQIINAIKQYIPKITIIGN